MSDSEDGIDLFQDPDDFYEKEKPATTVTHQLLDGTDLVLRLVGHSPLWGHFLWNAGRVISNHIEENADTLIQDRNVLELGAGAGLPSFICALRGANVVVVTDYPDADLIENLRVNIDSVKTKQANVNLHACGLLWGADVGEVKSFLPDGIDGFDILILADLLFNHSEHAKLVKTVQTTLRKEPGSKALVFFTPYRPWLFGNDMAFFDLARDGGFVVAKVLEHVMDKVMFEDDPA
ncbi:Lysine methyltransferase-like protein 7 [Elsinoe fawcettii]|nr:Lysine methyltransferase-like protein 7 [Elsinoe fawcettii]